MNLRMERDALRFDLKCKNAEAATLKGNTKRASGLYIEALFAMSFEAHREHFELSKNMPCGKSMLRLKDKV